jgi:hypothetical protein
LSNIRNFRRITRSLRFRLTVGYALFICGMLIGVGAIYYQRLAASLDAQIRDGLEQEWAGAKGFLRIENGQPFWFKDAQDPDESFIVGRIQRIYMLADESGNVLEISDTYTSIGRDSPAEIAAVLRSQQPR